MFRLALPGALMKLVGGDSGRVEHEELISEVLLGPSERAVVDVLFERPGRLTLEHRTPGRTYALAEVTVGDGRAPRSRQFALLRQAPELAAERRRIEGWLTMPPDKTLALVARMADPVAEAAGGEPVGYACPMHPEVTSDQPGRCPACGMKLLAVPAGDSAGAATSHSSHHHAAMAHHDHAATAHDAAGAADAAAEGIEWEDDMAEINRMTTPATMRWEFLETPTIRCTTPSTCTAPAGSSCWPATGRPSRTWSGRTPCCCAPARPSTSCSTFTNPGRWMAHCHIPEHMHSGMMFSFTVAPAI